MNTIIFRLSGLTCSACTKLISKRIRTIAGVEDVSVELPGTAIIKSPRKISDDEVKKVLEGTHYTVSGQN